MSVSSETPSTEFLHHVDEDDNVLGSISRGRAHAEGILHRSGIVFLMCSDRKILVQHRSPRRKIFPDCHDASAAFHVKFGESYEDAARRELREETGISAPLEYLGKFIHHDPPEHQIVAVFVGRGDAPVHIDLSEAVAAHFYDKAEIDDVVRSKSITPWLRDGWRLARDKI